MKNFLYKKDDRIFRINQDVRITKSSYGGTTTRRAYILDLIYEFPFNREPLIHQYDNDIVKRMNELISQGKYSIDGNEITFDSKSEYGYFPRDVESDIKYRMDIFLPNNGYLIYNMEIGNNIDSIVNTIVKSVITYLYLNHNVVSNLLYQLSEVPFNTIEHIETEMPSNLKPLCFISQHMEIIDTGYYYDTGKLPTNSLYKIKDNLYIAIGPFAYNKKVPTVLVFGENTEENRNEIHTRFN